MQVLFGRRKSFAIIDCVAFERRLHRTLGPVQLTSIGIGAIIGMGIYTLTGIGAAHAGLAVIVSFVIAGLVCGAAALAYAEMARMIPVAGSAYKYSYLVYGELIAWIVGLSLCLEYALARSAVAVGWSAYFAGLLHSIGVELPPRLLSGPASGGVFNLPAAVITLLVAVLLALGTRGSARLNTVLVTVKICALAVFAGFALREFDNTHLVPFAPRGTEGIMNAAVLVATAAILATPSVLMSLMYAQTRVFSCPAPFMTGMFALAGCVTLFLHLGAATIRNFLIWNAGGLVFYIFCSRSRSHTA